MTPVDAAAILARLVQFMGAAVLCGGAMFFLYGVTPDPRARWPLRLVSIASGAGVIGTAGWLMAQSAQIGSGPADAFNAATVWSVAADTGFGHVALLRLGLFLTAFVLAMVLRPGRRLWMGLSLAGAAASASFAWTGHGVRDEGLIGGVHIAADVAHLLAASAWIGALAGLAVLAVMAARPDAATGAGRDTLTGLVRFSALGVSVVAALVVSGLVNSWLLVGPTGVGGVLTTPYGQLLLLKLALFAAMLGLAAANRYRLTPQLERALAVDGADARAIAPVIRSILAELVLAVLVLALVSWLGTLSPPIDG